MGAFNAIAVMVLHLFLIICSVFKTVEMYHCIGARSGCCVSVFLCKISWQCLCLIEKVEKFVLVWLLASVYRR